MRAVVTVTGKDKKGIIAKVSAFLAERGVNIEDISQTLLQEYFAMITSFSFKKASVCVTLAYYTIKQKPRRADFIYSLFN